MKWKEDLSEREGIYSVRNPACGDIIRLHLTMMKNGKIRAVHNTEGCAASVASCSIMCDTLNELSLNEAVRYVGLFLKALGSETVDESRWNPSVEIEALLLFRNVAARRQCVSLAWTCAENALAALVKER